MIKQYYYSFRYLLLNQLIPKKYKIYLSLHIDNDNFEHIYQNNILFENTITNFFGVDSNDISIITDDVYIIYNIDIFG